MITWNFLRRRTVPVVTMLAQSECGLACLASIADYHHGAADMPAIRAACAHSGREVSLLHLRKVAETIGFSARALRCEPAGLKKLALPAILHWEMNHFVVAERVVAAGLVIVDPAIGRMTVPWSDVDRSFTGIALELATTETFVRRSGPRQAPSILSLVGPLSRWKQEIGALVAVSLVLEVLVIALPFQLRASIDGGLATGDQRFVLLLGVLFAILVLLRSSLGIVRGWLANVCSRRVGFELMDRFVRALHRKPGDFFLRRHTGDILNRSRSVIFIQQTLTAELLLVLLDMVLALSMLAVIFLAAPQMGAVASIFVLVGVAIGVMHRHQALDLARRGLRLGAKVDATFLENTRGVRAIRLHGRDATRIGLWRNRYVDYTNAQLDEDRVQLRMKHGTELVSGLGLVALITVGCRGVISGEESIGTVVLVILLRSLFFDRLIGAVNFFSSLGRAHSHGERLLDVIDDADDGLAVAGRLRPRDGPLDIELRDVWFRFGSDSPWILRGANARIAAGECVAITGASGAGKSTILSLMLGLIQPTKGEILVGGEDLRRLDPHALARAIGVVMQDDIVFEGTIAENIAFFDEEIDFDRVQLAAERADVARDIEALPMKMMSMMSEAGASLSGGQRQRLFIARALYHEPRMLFLDEATSHLDVTSEKRVSAAIASLAMTRVLVAHRAETIASASRVLRLSDGQLFDEPAPASTADASAPALLVD